MLRRQGTEKGLGKETAEKTVRTYVHKKKLSYIISSEWKFCETSVVGLRGAW